MSDEGGPEKRIGTVIKGKWTLDSLLGVGGMASVYGASHRNGQRAALKILHADFARDQIICERFLREGYVSNKIGHPAAVAVLDDDRTDDDAPFLVMELLEGNTVRELWKQAGRRMPVPQALKISDDILDCLVACHAIGVIHRDLKPANIFVTHAGMTKVLDFGVAQMRSATSERTATGTALGTPAYMSPEQAMGLVDQLDGRADLFSVGAMLHALVTGQRINNGRTENEALIMAATTPVPSVSRIAPDLPLNLIALIDKSLAWDRRNRHGDAREMQTAVRDLLAELEGPPPEAEPPSAAAPKGPVRKPSGLLRAAGRREIEIPYVEGEEQNIELAPQPAPQVGFVPGQGRAGAAAKGRKSGELPAAAPGAAVDVAVAAEDDPRVGALRDLFKRVDRLLPSVRQFGWDHPATERTMQQTFDGFVDALDKDPDVIDFTIRPYSLLHRGQTVWEPGPPFDSIPYNLFACGMRSMRMAKGLEQAELRSTFSLMLVDPGRDLPPEDDLAAAFWERGLPHVNYEVVDAFAEGGAAEREAFYLESDELERLASSASTRDIDRIEARVMVVSTDKSALGGARAKSPFTLEGHVRDVVGQRLHLDAAAWSERYVDALADGYIDAAIHRDAPLVLASLRKSSADLVVAGRLAVVVQLHDAIIKRLGERLEGQNLARLSSALTNALFGAETLDLALKGLHAHPEWLPLFDPILGVLNAAELPRVLAAYRSEPPHPVQMSLLRFIARTMRGQEPQVAAAAIGLSPESVTALLTLIARANTPEAKQALQLIASSTDDVNVRLEARVLSDGQAATLEIAALCDHAVALHRLAALRTLTRYRMRDGWTAVARIPKAPDFNERGQDERTETFRALIALSPERGEPIALDMAKKGGMFVSEGREATRIAAIDVLGELSRSSLVASGLREIAQSRWGTADETRAAAAEAAKRVEARMSGADDGGVQGSALAGGTS
jgi:eukaryotic-like serine/threonine-protein kinase